ELRKRKCLGVPGGFIEDELDLAAGCSDGGQAPAGGRLGALQGDRGLEQLLAAVDPQDAMAAKELVVHAVRRRQRPRVHGRKLLARLAAARLEDDHRLALVTGAVALLKETLRVPDRLDEPAD